MFKNFQALICSLTVALAILLIQCADDPVSSNKTGTIDGTVVESETMVGIPSVSITTTPGTSALLTNAQGEFTLEDVDVGTYSVRASKAGYETESVSILVKKNQTTIANIVMEKEETPNDAPNPPDNPTPENGATNQPIELTLAWSASDPNSNNTLNYDVYFGSSNSEFTQVTYSQKDTTYTLENLDYNTLYFWQIVVKDSEDLIRYGPVWSFTTISLPNNRIVFASPQEGNYNIYSASDSGSSLLQLTDDIGRDWWARLNPNRNKIAFVSNRAVDYHIFTMQMDGSNIQQITNLPIDSYHNNGVGFCWSHDGHHLLYGHYEKLYKIDDDGSNLTQIAQAPVNRHFRECIWSPLGDRIVALTIGDDIFESEIYLMDSDGENMKILVGDSAGVIMAPAFSPDGHKIAFTWDVSGHEVMSGRQIDSRIFIMDIDSTKAQDISKNKPAGTNDLFPRWSPGGNEIIFVNTPNDGVGQPDIWVMDADGSNRSLFISNGTMPDWK